MGFPCLQLGFQSKAEREPARQQFFDKELPRPLALAKYQEINRSLNSSSQAEHHREGSINYEDAQFFIKKPPFLKADEEKKSAWSKSLSAQLLCHGHSASRQVHIKKNLGNFYRKWSLQRRMWFLCFKDVTKWESTWNWTTQRMRTNLGLVWAKPMIWQLRTKRERVKDPMPTPAPSSPATAATLIPGCTKLSLEITQC